MISLQIKSSLVPIGHHPNRFSINLKRKKLHRQHIRQSVFIEFSSSITKIKVIYLDGVRSYKNLASGENNMRIYIWVESHRIHNSPFLFVYFFYWSYYSKYYLEYVISLQIKSSLVPIGHHPNRFSINLKRKKLHRQHIRQSVFIEFSSSITKIK